MIFDAAVIGAGPSGAACAAVLARSGARVALIDGGRGRAPVAEILDPSVRGLLGELGAWPAFASRGYAASPGKSVAWGDPDPVESESIGNPHGDSWVVERHDFDGLLSDHAVSCGAERILATCHRATGNRDGWQLQVDGQVVRARLLVQAQGRAANLVGNASRIQLDDDVSFAAIGDVPSSDGDHRLRVERTPTGWWYAATRASGSAVVAFLTGREAIPRARSARTAWWRAELARTRLLCHHAAHPPADVQFRPAYGSIRTEISGETWCCVGDAAATYDPMTGQGVATAIAKGIALARLVADHRPVQAFSTYEAAERDGFAHYVRARRRYLTRLG